MPFWPRRPSARPRRRAAGSAADPSASRPGARARPPFASLLARSFGGSAANLAVGGRVVAVRRRTPADVPQRVVETGSGLHGGGLRGVSFGSTGSLPERTRPGQGQGQGVGLGPISRATLAAPAPLVWYPLRGTPTALCRAQGARCDESASRRRLRRVVGWLFLRGTGRGLGTLEGSGSALPPNPTPEAGGRIAASLMLSDEEASCLEEIVAGRDLVGSRCFVSTPGLARVEPGLE